MAKRILWVAACIGCLLPAQAWACGIYFDCTIDIVYQGKTKSAEGSSMGNEDEALKQAREVACKKLCKHKEGDGKACVKDCNANATVKKSKCTSFSSKLGVK